MGEIDSALTVTYPELLALLWTLRAVTLPGLEPVPLASWPAEQVSELMLAAKRSLRARRLMRKEDEVAPHVATLLSGCTEAEEWIRFIRTSASWRPAMRFYYLTSEAVVEHALSEEGLHCLTRLADRTALIEHLAASLQLQPGSAELGVRLQLPFATLQQAARVARETGMAAAEAVLAGGGVSAEPAAALAEALSRPRSNGSLTLQQKWNGTAAQGFSYLEGEGSIWLVLPLPEDVKAVRVESTTAAQIMEYLRGWFDAPTA